MTRGDRLTKHHFWWPRKKYPEKNFRKVHIWIPYALHMAYHEFFIHNCRTARKCDGCKYFDLCCYAGTEVA